MSIAGSITGDIKTLLAIRIKPRHDGMCDQYHRIFMVKILLVSTIIIGVNQYKDSIACIVPEGQKKNFISLQKIEIME